VLLSFAHDLEMAASAEQSFLPIAELSAYQTKWTIKARVTTKGTMREFNRGRQGKVFHVELLDAMGGEIRASFFNQAADKCFNMLEKGKCFTFSRGSIKVANKQYNSTNHRYELTFDKDAIVEPAKDDASIEAIKFSFVSLKALAQRNLPATVDLCGIITSFKPTLTVNSKEGVELVKRDITIADDSATSITVALWGDRAKQEDRIFEGNPVVVLKAVAVKAWNESRQGSLLQAGELIFQSDMPEAKRVQQWWTQSGSSQQIVQLSAPGGGAGGEGARARNATQTSLAGLRLAAERLGSQPEVFSTVCRLSFVTTRKQGEVQPLHYMACQEPKESSYNSNNTYPCNKRVDPSGFCPSCNRAGKVAPRLNIRCKFIDAEDQAWLGSFHEAASKILGMSGEEVQALELAASERGEAGREELENTIRKKYFQQPLNVTVRAKLDTYNGEVRPNISIIDARPVSHSEHGRHMLKEINQLLSSQALAGA